MGHHSQSLCSPFLCQVTIEEKRLLLPKMAICHPMLIVRRSSSKREEELTFMEHWSHAGCQLDNCNEYWLAHTRLTKQEMEA